MTAPDELHEMRRPQIEKVVVHMGVGEGGRSLQDAEAILEQVTGQEPVRTEAVQSEPDFDIRRGDPIGCKVTLRGDDAEAFLEEALAIVGGVDRAQFDDRGNFSFGVEEHTDFEGLDYDPEIGIYGLDVTVALARKGKRVERRATRSRRLPERQQLDADDAHDYVTERFEVDT